MLVYESDDVSVFLPMPLFLVVEDVGWWRGEDGSCRNEPFRNKFVRRHCLADYGALVALAGRLSMRIAIGMVVGEWDRTNLLRKVTGATWMGKDWDNRVNQGPWLDEAARYLRANGRHLEIAVHGLCHEFWEAGKMVRAEFHDKDGNMRPRAVVVDHLEAYAAILEQNGFSGFPEIYIPPALCHAFGNGEDGMQAILRDFGVRCLTTRFSKARRHAPPVHENITWECGVTLLERGLSPVDWDETAKVADPVAPNPILALHWANLLDPDPDRNGEVVNRWADHILRAGTAPDRVLSRDAAACWRQAAVFYLAGIAVRGKALLVDLTPLPDIPALRGPFDVKIRGGRDLEWQCEGAGIETAGRDSSGILTLRLTPGPGVQTVCLKPAGR